MLVQPSVARLLCLLKHANIITFARITHPVAGKSAKKRAKRSSDIRLLALDMDGTLLDSNSKVLPSSVEAIKVTA